MKKMMTNKFQNEKKFGFRAILLSILAILMFFSASTMGCSSVFSAGLSGKIVDAESSANPKAGIQDVEVFVYTKEKVRDADFNSWDGISRFSPDASKPGSSNKKYYIGHATTNSSGEFTLSKVVWESFFPEFGKTADQCQVYLIFYHENFGLVKNSNIAVVMSDATANSVYQELTKIRTTTVLNLSIRNIAKDTLVSETVIAKISVPQANGTKLYTETITTGTATIPVTYPRYSSGTTENEPTISITLEQNGNNQKFKQCKNGGTTGVDFAFTTEPITATIKGDSCPVETYMKAYRIAVPTVSGQYKAGTNDDSCDGKTVSFFIGTNDEAGRRGSAQTYDATSTSGGSVYQKHGMYTIEGSGYWENTTYTGKIAEADIYFTVNDAAATPSITKISSSDTNVTVNLD